MRPTWGKGRCGRTRNETDRWTGESSGDITVMAFTVLQGDLTKCFLVRLMTTKQDIIDFKENRNGYKRKNSCGTLQSLHDHNEVNAEYWFWDIFYGMLISSKVAMSIP